MGSLTPESFKELSLHHLLGLEVVPGKYASIRSSVWGSLAVLTSFPSCEHYIRKILPLVHFFNIETQRKEYMRQMIIAFFFGCPIRRSEMLLEWTWKMQKLTYIAFSPAT